MYAVKKGELTFGGHGGGGLKEREVDGPTWYLNL